MKTANFNDIKVDGENFTITGTITDTQFTGRTQQVTISHFPDPTNRFCLDMQISNQAVFVKKFGADSFAVPNSELTKLAIAMIPEMNPPPAPEPLSKPAVYPLPKPEMPDDLKAALGIK